MATTEKSAPCLSSLPFLSGRPGHGPDYEKIKFVLTIPRLNESAVDVSQQIQMQYSKWKKVNIAIRCYILVSVVGHLQEQISKFESGAEMI